MLNMTNAAGMHFLVISPPPPSPIIFSLEREQLSLAYGMSEIISWERKAHFKFLKQATQFYKSSQKINKTDKNLNET